MSKIEELEEKLQLLEAADESTPELVDLLVQLARSLNTEEPRKGIELARRALAVANEIAYERGIAYSKLAVGGAQVMLSDYDQAFPTLMESLSLFKDLGDEIGKAQNLGSIAQVQLSRGEYDQALGNALEALRVFEKTGQRQDEAWVTNGIGTGYHEMGDYERSLDFHNRALKIFRELGVAVGEGRALSGIGTVYQSLCDYEKAVEYHEQSLELFRATGNRIGESRALNDIGVISKNVGEFEQAREFHQRSLGIRRELGSRQAESTSLLNLGRLAIAEEDGPVAIETLNAALNIAEEVKARPRIYQCHEALSRAYELTGDLEQALLHHQEFHRIKEEVAGEEAASRVRNLQVGFEVEKSEHEAEIARLKNVELRDKNEQLETLLAELKAAEAQLIQSEKMAALGGIVSGIVHELNTPLGVINSAVEMAAKWTDDIRASLDSGNSIETLRSNPRFKTALEAMHGNTQMTQVAASRIAKITANLKSFARLDGALFEQVDLHEGIETTLALLENRIQSRIEIIRDYGDLPPVACYASEMNQLFLNVLTNAIQAIRGEGSITIRTYHEDGSVRLHFSDTGVGIQEEHIPHVFNPTFTTGGTRVKASFGLAACYNIVEKHSGEISVESQVGQGTTLKVSIPTSLQVWPQLASR